jgi:hypothetical protein
MSLDLLTPWVFWYSDLSKAIEKPVQRYEEELVPIVEVFSLTEFFNAYCFLAPVNDLKVGDSLSLFRKGKKPLWESCITGGCWIIRVPRKEASKAQSLWEALLVEAVRGGFTEDVAGIMVNSKKFELSLQVWMYEAAAAHKKVAADIKEVLKVGKLEMYLKFHKDSIHDMSTFRNSKKITC